MHKDKKCILILRNMVKMELIVLRVWVGVYIWSYGVVIQYLFE